MALRYGLLFWYTDYMDSGNVFSSIYMKNILSFSAEGMELKLLPLNVIVGTNGAGKSNLIECIRLIKSFGTDLSHPFLQTGGVSEWVNKTRIVDTFNYYRSLLSIGVVVKVPNIPFQKNYNVVHDTHLIENKFRVEVAQEFVFIARSEEEDIFEHPESNDAFLYFNNGEELLINQLESLTDPNGNAFSVDQGLKELRPGSILRNQSIVAQKNDPDSYEELSSLKRIYDSIRLYSDFQMGRTGIAKRPQDAALDSTFLFEDASNLALVLNDLQNQPQSMRIIIERLKQFYPRVENIITRVQGGTVQIYFQEEGLTQTVPATRLSDGTLRYLCLLVILCHPTPPPLICIEEPELGMHPDIIPIIAELLIEASQRTQLIVTTHSTMLVSAIGETDPEAVVVCERDDDGTQMRRLDKEQLAPWLERYSLGDLWMKGEIGGTRW